MLIPSIIIETCYFSEVNLQTPLFSSTNQWEKDIYAPSNPSVPPSRIGCGSHEEPVVHPSCIPAQNGEKTEMENLDDLVVIGVLGYTVMSVKQCHVYPPPVISIFIGGIRWYVYHAQIGGL